MYINVYIMAPNPLKFEGEMSRGAKCLVEEMDLGLNVMESVSGNPKKGPPKHPVCEIKWPKYIL